jgi:hypothetical protein
VGRRPEPPPALQGLHRRGDFVDRGEFRTRVHRRRHARAPGDQRRRHTGAGCLASLLLALATCLLAIGILWRRSRALRWAFRLEITCLAGSLLLLVLPIGANHGPVAWMTNVALPIALIVLLRKPLEAFT